MGWSTSELERKMSLLSAATRLGITVMGSATLYQARLTQGLPGFSAAFWE